MSQKIEKIYEYFLTNSYSKEELEELLKHFESFGETSPLRTKIRQELENSAPNIGITQERITSILTETDKEISDWIKSNKTKKIKVWKWAAMAAALLLFGVSVWYWSNLYSDGLKDIEFITDLTDIQVRERKPVLQLSDGTSFTLREGEDLVADGENSYSYSDGTPVADGLIEKSIAIVIPKGMQYKVKLPDGTNVWLNAKTTLAYSSSFNEDIRRVTLDGEAYFEVAHDPHRKFVIKSANEEIKVLGTKFSVRNYQPDNTLTTLVEGQVQVDIPNKLPIILNPGEQLAHVGSSFQVRRVKVESYIGWKDAMFIFHNTALKDVLLELTHWYDLNIDYSKIPNNVVYAEIHRNTDLQAVLKYIEQASGVQFSLKGRRLEIK